MVKRLYFIILSVLIFGNCHSNQTFNSTDFEKLMTQLVTAWNTQNTMMGVNCFTNDAIYMQPPNVQFYQGKEQLSAYFGALKPGTNMQFHQLWYNEKTQLGAGEFTFGMEGKEVATVGIAIVRIEKGLIAEWREYLQTGPSNFKEFISTKDKNWEWHIGNYPTPVDTQTIKQ